MSRICVVNAARALWRRVFSSSSILWVLVVFLIAGVISVSSAWDLELSQSLSTLVAALAIPLAFMTQREILRENQRMTLRQQAYADLREQFEILRNSLIDLSIFNINRKKSVVEQSIAIRKAAASLTYTYHSHEMTLIKIDRYFKYFHFSLLDIAQKLDAVAALANYNVYGDTDYEDKAEALLLSKKIKDQCDDLKSYLYDFQKELIEELGFSKLFGVVVESRKPKLKKYKTLSQVATKQKVRQLQKKFEDDSGHGKKVKKK